MVRLKSLGSTARMAAVILLSLMAQHSSAQVQDSRWSGPVRISSLDGHMTSSALIADRRGGTHAFWFEERSAEKKFMIFYARLDGAVWSTPVLIHEEELEYYGKLSRVDATADGQGVFHLVWSGNWGPVFYARCPAADALDASKWSAPATIDVPAYLKIMRVSSTGVLHLIYMKFYGEKPNGVYYVRSENGGQSWTPSVWLDPDIPPGYTVQDLRFELDGSDGLHVLWSYVDPSISYIPGKWIRYSSSYDGGRIWQTPFTIDKATEQTPDVVRVPIPGLAVSGQTVHVVWSGGGEINVGRRHRFSTDAGRTWSDIKQIFGNLVGAAESDGLAIDDRNRLHFLGQIRYPQGLWYAQWDSGRWSDPSMIYLIAKDWQDPMGDRVHAHSVRLVIPGQDHFVTTFTNCGACGDGSIYSGKRFLFTMNTKKLILFLPHFADGGGYSMSFAVSNLSDSPAAGLLKIYDSGGLPQTVSFDTQSASEMSFALGPRETKLFRTAGTSNTVKTGYVLIEFDRQFPVSGTAIFHFAAGLEASVLPTNPGSQFALFVERSPVFDTGVAVLRLTGTPIELKLYDSAGQLKSSRTWDFPGRHQARFIGELFDVPETFKGLLIMKSDGDFAPLGLRFGDRVRSTIPVSNLDFKDSQKEYYFPQFADGDGWSMIISNSNLSGTAAAGRMSFFDSSGKLQPIPAGDTSASEISLNLAPLSTNVLTTTGSSNPLKKGYVKVDMGQNRASGVAIFRFGSGLEASALPTRAGRRFAVFTERSAAVETGVAVVRLTSQPVNYKIYDAQGNVVQAGVYPLAATHEAKFVSEFANLPDKFTGLLILESEGDFAPLGLRFGSGILSTIPIVGF